MKKLYILLAITTLLSIGCSKSFDDSALNDRIDDLENRVVRLEELCNQMNTNILSLQTLVTALQSNDYITNVAPININGQTIGYTIAFAKSSPITIYHGQNGEDGAEGAEGRTPIVGIRQHTDGNYYWTLDGDWLLDNYGRRIKAEGSNGGDGVAGKDGVTPQLKIENGYWYVSYGSGWTRLGPAVNQEGVMFESIDISSDYVTFTFPNGKNYPFQVPKLSDIDIVFRIDGEEIADLVFDQHETKQIRYVINRSYSPTAKPIVLKAEMLNGDGRYVLHITPNKMGDRSGTITISAMEFPTINRIIVSVYDGSTTTIMRSINVSLKSGLEDHTLYVPQADIFDEIWKRESSKLDTMTHLKVVGILSGTDVCSFESNARLVSLDLEDVDLVSGEIAFRCFSKNIRNLKLPKTLKSIPNSFVDSYTFYSITIPESVTSIGYFAFYNCKISQKMVISQNVKEIGFQAFWHASFDGGLEIFGNNLTIEASAFEGCNLNGALELHRGVPSIGESAFESCKGSGDLTLPFGLRTIGKSAFQSASFDGKLTIPEGVDIGAKAFYGSKISGHLFIPRNITLGDQAFAECRNLTSFIFEDEMISEIKKGMFESCSGLSGELSIPETVKVIGESAFYRCTGFTGDLVIPDQVTTIGKRAFQGCTGFTGKIVIGKNVESISSLAFYELRIPIIYCKAVNPPQVSLSDLESVIQHIYVPTGSKEAYLAHPDWSRFARIIEETTF